jgi:hypothetical protein
MSSANDVNDANGVHANGYAAPTYDIPKECKAGVVVDEGPNFRVEVQMVPVPEIGAFVTAPSIQSFQYLCYLPTLNSYSSNTTANPQQLTGPEDVLLKLNATGICHSDIHFMLNDWGVGPMSQYGTRCAGHEGAGVIVKVGERVKNLKVGMRAGFKPILDTCGCCDECRRGKETYCTKAVLTGLHTDGMSEVT